MRTAISTRRRSTSLAWACISRKLCELACRPFRLRLRRGVKGAVEPPPLPLDLALQRSQFFKAVGHGVHRFHRHLKACSLFVLSLIHPSDAARKLRERHPPRRPGK